MSTRAAIKKKRQGEVIALRNGCVSRSLPSKRPRAKAKRMSVVPSILTTETDDNNRHAPDTTENEAIEGNESLADRHVNGFKTGDLVKHNKSNTATASHLPIGSKNSCDEDIERMTNDAYQALEDSIAMCEPVLNTASAAATVYKPPLTNSEISIVHSRNDTQLMSPPVLSRPTPTTVRSSGAIASAKTPSNRPRQSGLPATSRSSLSVLPSTSRNRVSHPASSTCKPYSINGKETPFPRRNVLPNINSSGNRMRSIVTPRSSIHTQSTTIGGPTTSTPVSVDNSALTAARKLALLDSFPEYRSLQRELLKERQRCTAWADDYRKLKAEFDSYRASSFPRPTVEGLNFLLQLIENLTLTTTFSDPRTKEELAESIGLSEEKLIECFHSNPQRAALKVFSALYPTYSDRLKLVSVKKLFKKSPRLMEDILTFARQCNPSTLFTMEKMCEAIGSSIRQAKHQTTKTDEIELELAGIAAQERDNDESDYELDNEQSSTQNRMEIEDINDSSGTNIKLPDRPADDNPFTAYSTGYSNEHMDAW